MGCENLAILHRIVHFDLKSANVLLGRDWTAKIADVGLAKILPGYSIRTSQLNFSPTSFDIAP